MMLPHKRVSFIRSLLACLVACVHDAAGREIDPRNDLSLCTIYEIDSNLLIQGSTVKASSSVTLDAGNKVQLLAAQNTARQTSSNNSSSASIGISIGTSGFGVTVSGSAGRGNADGNDATHTNTRINGNRVSIGSGGDTDIKGAVVKDDTVTAKIGGNLNIESLQDTSTYKERSAGGSVTVGAGAGGSFCASSSNIDSHYASVRVTFPLPTVPA